MNRASEKPQLGSIPFANTQTVENVTQQSINDPMANTTTRSVNAYGLQMMKGGNVLGSNIYQATLAALNNLAYQPIAMPFFIISTLYYISTMTGNLGGDPFLISAHHLQLGYTKSSGVRAGIIAFAAGGASFIEANKDVFALFMACSYPYLAKPSKRNIIFATILWVLLYVGLYKPFAILGVTFGFYLFTQYRDPRHKMVAVLVISLCFIFSPKFVSDTVGIEEIKKKHGGYPGSPPATETRSADEETIQQSQPSSAETTGVNRPSLKQQQPAAVTNNKTKTGNLPG